SQQKIENKIKYQEGKQLSILNLYPVLKESLERHNPMNLTLMPDEYLPETLTILRRLPETHSATDIARIIYEEFNSWFKNVDTDQNDFKDKCRQVSEEVWEAMRQFGNL